MKLHSCWRRLNRLVPVAALALLAGACAAQPRAAEGPADSPAGLVLGPYVNGVSQNGARIHFVSSPGAQSECTVTGGPDEVGGPKVQMSVSPLTGQAEVVQTADVSGLKPGRKYQYALTCAGRKALGAFQTAPAAGSREPFTFIVYGDPQGRPSRHKAVAEAILREPAPAFLLVLGDYTDDGLSWPRWRNEFFDPARELLRRQTAWTIRGNHEMNGVTFKELFGLYNESPHYSFDYANLHVVCLDQYRDKGLNLLDGAGEAEIAAWVDKDLWASKAPWKIVAFHEPMFNVGGHGSTWGRGTVLPVLQRHGVDVLLSGHSHLYERFVPIGPKGAKPLLQIVSGGGGGTTYDSEPSPALAATYSGIHYCAITVRGETLQVAAKTPDGNVIDSFWLVQTGGLYQKEVMDAAMEPNLAMGLMKVFKTLLVTFEAVPKAGAESVAVIPAGSFPAGCQVRLGKSQSCAWNVKPAEFADGGGELRIAVTPPAAPKLSATPWNGVFAPPLAVSLSLTCQGRTFHCESVDSEMTPEDLRKLLPPAFVADVPRAAGEIKIDGRLDDWKGLAPLPTAQGPGKALRLAWGPAGLYGALSAPGGKVEAGSRSPADGLELHIEMDARRRLAYSLGARAARILLYPSGDAAGGPAGVLVRYGSLKKEQVSASWRKTDAGYDLEFLIPADALTPAKLAGGTEMGFHFALLSAGRPVETFVDTAPFQSVTNSPIFWGTLRLREK